MILLSRIFGNYPRTPLPAVEWANEPTKTESVAIPVIEDQEADVCTCTLCTEGPNDFMALGRAKLRAAGRL